MKESGILMRKFGLIGKKLGHSFSKNYFTSKFEQEGITDAQYELYELPEIEELLKLLANTEGLLGLNVTIPYKQQVLPLLDELDVAAARIGAVNTIKVQQGKTKGYNTDYIGFKQTLEHFYPFQQRQQALILGTGGAAQAVIIALQDLEIPYKVVSRKPALGEISYEQLTPEVMAAYNLVVNTTPLGMAPDINSCPNIPYETITANHFLYDLVYNPEETQFLERGKLGGAKVLNGLPMLYAQAEASWQIWNA